MPTATPRTATPRTATPPGATPDAGGPRDVAERVVARLRDDLADQAHLFEDPRTYLAGVEDALTALRPLLAGIPGAEPQPAAVVRGPVAV